MTPESYAAVHDWLSALRKGESSPYLFLKVLALHYPDVVSAGDALTMFNPGDDT